MCALRYRADTQVGPYNGIRNDDNTVKMIRHDHELVRFDRGEFAFQFSRKSAVKIYDIREGEKKCSGGEWLG